MQVIGKRGETTFMLLTKGRRNALQSASVRVLDTSTGAIGPEMPALSVVARGYWTDDLTGVDTKAVLELAESVLAAAA